MIIAVVGPTGSGKSLTATQTALEWVNRKQKQLVCNYPLNLRELYKYADLKGYEWVKYLIKRGCIIQICNAKKLEALMIPNSVVLLDEAGIFLNARDFVNTSKTLLADLCQSRKDGIDLFWMAQFDDQVDRHFRKLTHFFIHCDAMTTYNKKLKNSAILWKKIFWFKANDYYQWLEDKNAVGSYIRTWFAYSMKSESGPLTAGDYQMLKCFDSFARLDTNLYPDRIRTLERCELPPPYYFECLAESYRPEFDPLSKVYQPLYGYYFAKTTPHREAPQPIQRGALIKKAIEVCRNKGVRGPLFKSMVVAAIRGFIAQNG